MIYYTTLYYTMIHYEVCDERNTDSGTLPPAVKTLGAS
jgi:hypothetical protein